jgi:hypothetical protein
MSAVKKETSHFQNCAETGRQFHLDQYPKKCSCCKKEFLSRESYWDETEALVHGNYSRGTNSSVFEYRNCTDCKSTLVTKFVDQRDLSTEGLKKRTEWGKQFEFLVANGVDPDRAKSILKKKK